MDRRAAGDQGAHPAQDVVREALTARATVDEHGTVTAWNDGAERLLGYPSRQILGRPAATLLAEAPPAPGLPPFAQLPRWHGKLALRHQDGHRVEAGVLAHHRASDRGSGGWLVLVPLTGLEERPTDDALVRWSFAQSPCCALALYDTGLRLRRANTDMERSVALTEGEMRGLRVPEIVDHEAGDLAEQDMLRVLETGGTYYRENFLRAPGEYREHAWSVFVSPLRDPDGHIQGVCLSAHDTTEQRWARTRLQLIAEVGKRIGSTLDVTRTAQELADVAVPVLADFVSVDLLTSLDDGGAFHAVDPVGEHAQFPGSLSAGRSLSLRRVAHQSALPGVPEAAVAPGEVDEYPAGSPPVETCRAAPGDRARDRRMGRPGARTGRPGP
jgi:PAS domain S-box-containing protein